MQEGSTDSIGNLARDSDDAPWPVRLLRRHLPMLVVANMVVAGVLLGLVFWARNHSEALVGVFLALLLLGVAVQAVAGLAALFIAGSRLKGVLAVATTPFLLMAALWGMLSGMGWGRPLRVRGKQVFPQLTGGADWTEGARPDPAGLDTPTRAALEALWLHDAQKEHASVPAFARISWMLAAAGAPAELMAWSQRAALEEVDHARKCFALAAGYGGRTHTVEPMPDLLLAGLELQGDPLVALAVESLQDGCLMEEFNADAAAACAAACEAPVTRSVLEQIAREERSHAEFSWAVLQWALCRAPAQVTPAVHEAAGELHRIARPRAAGAKHWLLVAKADPQQLLRHGRIPDAQLAPLWDARLQATRERLNRMLLEEAPLLRTA